MSGPPTGLVLARTTKRATEDGLCELEPGVEVGREYLIDLHSLRVATLLNTDQKVTHTKTIVNTLDRQTGFATGWLPIEMLEMP